MKRGGEKEQSPQEVFGTGLGGGDGAGGGGDSRNVNTTKRSTFLPGLC